MVVKRVKARRTDRAQHRPVSQLTTFFWEGDIWKPKGDVSSLPSCIFPRYNFIICLAICFVHWLAATSLAQQLQEALPSAAILQQQ
jgi:hypothetical protein